MQPTVGVIGFRNTSYVVGESDGSITVHVQFLSPMEISSDIVVPVTLSTEDDSAVGNKNHSETNSMYSAHI